MGIGVPGGGDVGPSKRLHPLGAKPSASGLDVAAVLSNAGEEAFTRFRVREVKHLPPPVTCGSKKEEGARHRIR
jgi:hypothetical protein